MNVRINVPLKRVEKAALTRLAEQEKRDPRQQAALLIRQGLERAGFLEDKSEVPSRQDVEFAPGMCKPNEREEGINDHQGA